MSETTIDVAAWDRDGSLHLPGLLDANEVGDLRAWVDDIAARRNGDGGVLQHYERGAAGAQIARSEYLLDLHPGLTALVTSGRLPSIGAALVGEPVVLYKEKINYKLVGGAGFNAHQDARAYKFVDIHLTCMIAIDPADATNGCLEFAAGMHGELLAADDDGCIHPDIVAALDWQALPVEAGDVVWFHSRVPHRSGPNRGARTRRALFCTYNAASLGDLRQEYYADKLRYFSEHLSTTARVSTIGDFQGVAPSDDELRKIGAS